MDSGKLAALKKVNWKPAKCCATCHFGSFKQDQEWGICTAKSNDYFHNKHQREHSLPAHRGTVCDKYCFGNTRDEIINFLNSTVTS